MTGFPFHPSTTHPFSSANVYPPPPPAFASSHSLALAAILIGTDWNPARLIRRRHWSAIAPDHVADLGAEVELLDARRGHNVTIHTQETSLSARTQRLPPGVTTMSPFAEESSLNKVGVQSFPEELFSVLRTIQLLRGLTVGMGLRFSCAQQWKPIAEEALLKSGRLQGILN
uniref:Uncharacterized protein n=1 Tax=Leersia perrieri TaxID=77586 RepID=A0A0D9V961_9ORYZ